MCNFKPPGKDLKRGFQSNIHTIGLKQFGNHYF